MKPFVLALFSLGVVAVSALPVVLLDDAASGSSDLTMRSGGAGGFQDYVIVPGPTGVDLAGAINEIPGYGVSALEGIFKVPVYSLSDKVVPG